MNDATSNSLTNQQDQTLNKSRSSKHRGCRCRGDCRSFRCGCNAKQSECSENCGCNNLTCKNRKNCHVEDNVEDNVVEAKLPNLDESDTEDLENIDIENKNYTFIKHEADELINNNNNINNNINNINININNNNNNTPIKSNLLLTPQLIRRSAIQFDTNSATKKFFH